MQAPARARPGRTAITQRLQKLRHLPRPWLAVGAALASALELLLSQWVSGGLFDFHMYLNAAWAARLDGTIYPNPSLGAGAHVVNPTAHYFIYPVPFVLLLLPLTFLPTWAAELCARLGEIALLALTAWALIRSLAPGKRELERAAWAAAAVFHLPIITRVDSLGQADAAVLALAALSLLAAARGSASREWWAGLALGAAALIKPYIGFLVLFYLWKRQWRAVAGTIGAACAGLGIGALALGLPDTVSWLQSSSSAMTPDHVASSFTVSLYGLAVRSALALQPALFPAELPLLHVAAWGLVGLGALFGTRFIRSGHFPISLSADEYALRYGWEFALAVTLLLLTLPTIEDLHTSLYVIPVVLLGLLTAQMSAAWLRQQPRSARAFWWGLALLALYLSLTSAAFDAFWQSATILLPIWTALNWAHEAVAWLAVPVALILLAHINRSIHRGKTPLGAGIALFQWSLAAVFSLRVTVIEYLEQADHWPFHAGTTAAWHSPLAGLHPLAGLVPVGTVAALSIALIAAARLNLVPQQQTEPNVIT
jgi:hypothetical protein